VQRRSASIIIKGSAAFTISNYPKLIESELDIIMQTTFRIIDEDGIHARPATALVNTATKFKGTEAFAEAKGKKVTLKSILGVLSLGLEAGDTLTLITEGSEEAEALSALQEIMVKEGLGEVHE
jgi:phosphocarrier protein HPr